MIVNIDTIKTAIIIDKWFTWSVQNICMITNIVVDKHTNRVFITTKTRGKYAVRYAEQNNYMRGFEGLIGIAPDDSDMIVWQFKIPERSRE